MLGCTLDPGLHMLGRALHSGLHNKVACVLVQHGVVCCFSTDKCLADSGLSIRAGSRPKQPATGQTLAAYFRLTLLLILVRNLK